MQLSLKQYFISPCGSIPGRAVTLLPPKSNGQPKQPQDEGQRLQNEATLEEELVGGYAVQRKVRGRQADQWLVSVRVRKLQ